MLQNDGTQVPDTDLLPNPDDFDVFDDVDSTEVEVDDEVDFDGNDNEEDSE